MIGNEYVHVFLLFLFICLHWRSNYQEKGSVGILLTNLTQSHFEPVPCQDLDFQFHMSWSSLCSMSWGGRWLFISFWFWWKCWPSLIKLSFHDTKCNYCKILRSSATEYHKVCMSFCLSGNMLFICFVFSLEVDKPRFHHNKPLKIGLILYCIIITVVSIY